MAEHLRTGKLAVILHADIAGSTELVKKDEQLAHVRIQETFRRFGNTITKYHGSVRELRGDALLAEFERASDAVTAALAFQADQLDYLAQLNDSIRPTLRVGIAMGEVIIADDTITGEGVVLAQRLEQLAGSGSVVIQGAAYETIPGRFPFEYDNLGEHQVKGFDEPVRAYEARLKGGTDLPKSSPTVHRTRNTLIAFASVAVVAAGVALMWFKPWEVREEPASIERLAFPLPDKPSIAVLPFDNLSGDPDHEYLSKGLTENIITELSRFKFFVIDRKSSFAYKDESPKIRQVAEELGVRYVVEGSVQISGDTARVTVQLIDAISGRHLWAERFDRDLQDLFKVQDEITRTIAATVKENIRLAEFDYATRKPVENLSAYEYRTRGMAQWVKFTKEGNEQAKQLVEKALALDPNYSEAYVGLAWVHINGYRWGWSETYSREESLSLAFEMATRAVELDPFNYKTHAVLAKVWMYRGDLDQAIAEYDRARELNPNSATVLMSSAELLVYLGRAEEAISQLNTAIRINPRHPDGYHWSLAWAQYFAEQYEDALASLRKMNKMPNGARRTLAPVLMRLGRVEEARAVIAEFLTNEPEYSLEDAKVWPYEHKEYLERWTEDLRKAGVPEHPPLKLPDKPSIAVLPFTNMSDDTQQEYFVDGMTEDLITDLSKISGLFVIARNSSFTYKGKAVNVKNVARDLGVRYVLEGSVRRAGNQVRINAQLIDATTDGHLWAERYDGSLQDIFALQDQVTQKIVTALEVSLTAEVGRKRHETKSVEAYDTFLQGWAYYQLRTPDDFLKAVSLFEAAIRLDSGYSRAHAALAGVYWDALQNRWVESWDMPSFRAHDRAEEHMQEAMKLPTPLLHSLSSRMLVSQGFYDDAVSEARQAVALDANDSASYAALANALILAGQPVEGIDLIHKAMRLDPHYSPSYLITLGQAQFGLERFEDAADTFERTVKRNPDDELPWIYLAAAYGHLDRKSEGNSAFESVNDLRARAALGEMMISDIRFNPRFGASSVRNRVLSGLSELPALTWPTLVSQVGRGSPYEIDTDTAKSMYDRGVPFIDVRTIDMFNAAHIRGAINLPVFRASPAKTVLTEAALLNVVGKNQEVIIYSGTVRPEYRSTRATAKILAWGYENVYNFTEGLRGWQKASYPIESE